MPKVKRKLILIFLGINMGITLLVVTALFMHVPPPRPVAGLHSVVVIHGEADDGINKPKLDVYIKKEVHHVRQNVR